MMALIGFVDVPNPNCSSNTCFTSRAISYVSDVSIKMQPSSPCFNYKLITNNIIRGKTLKRTFTLWRMTIINKILPSIIIQFASPNPIAQYTLSSTRMISFLLNNLLCSAKDLLDVVFPSFKRLFFSFSTRSVV